MQIDVLYSSYQFLWGPWTPPQTKLLTTPLVDSDFLYINFAYFAILTPTPLCSDTNMDIESCGPLQHSTIFLQSQF